MICAIRLDKTSACSSSTMPLFAILAGAFSFGFLESFSPCLMILLSFVLSYSMGETIHFKEGFLRVVTFGIGFILATVLVFLRYAGLIIASSAFAFQDALMYVVLEILGAEITLSPVHVCAMDAIRKGNGLAIRFPRFSGVSWT